MYVNKKIPTLQVSYYAAYFFRITATDNIILRHIISYRIVHKSKLLSKLHCNNMLTLYCTNMACHSTGHRLFK